MAREWISNEGNRWENEWKTLYGGKSEELDKVAFKIIERMKYYDNVRIEIIDENKGDRDKWCAVSQMIEGLEQAMFCLIRVIEGD